MSNDTRPIGFIDADIIKAIKKEIKSAVASATGRSRRRKASVEKQVKAVPEMIKDFDYLPGDVAVAIDHVLNDMADPAATDPIEFSEDAILHHSPFGTMKEPFSRTAVKDPGSADLIIPWGRWVVKGLGAIEPRVARDEIGGSLILFPKAGEEVDEGMWNAIIEAVEARLKAHSIFRGRAVQMRNANDTRYPAYIDTTRPVNLILNRDIEEALEDSLFHVIDHAVELRAAGVRLKRGVILEGHYGAGKTLTAYATAQRTAKAGFSFVMASARMARIGFLVAKMMQPAVLFVEDLDAAAHGDRDRLNDLLNTISGVETKGAEVILMVSTNFIERIDPAFLRPERLDSIITMDLPNQGTIDRLLRHYCGDRLAAEGAMDEYNAVCAYLLGATPAIISEVADRARIRSVATGGPIYPERLMTIAKQMDRQKALATPRFVSQTDAEQLEEGLGKIVRKWA